MLLVELDPARAGEAAKTRPCIVVSNAGVNAAVTRAHKGAIVVVPVTASVGYVHPDSQVLIDDQDALADMGLAVPSKAQADQIRAISAERIQRIIGRAPAWVGYQLDDAIRFHLSL
ncbi:type II toxin-antitoxin system PemK/MazF family toxin [Leifsonia sp. Root227]|uniref:type II toxin-antitoxin system PemK/MazF family toxin n=1 Tax=Leifsonia sp. Root227 TaxID=1736496 RepID=UPI001F1D9D1E|nr:type II toxin-antitoxin system PemK/MazF family toxin [Leifsonia sp. Root227]